MYQDKANVVWNGNAVSGSDAILKLFDGLPTSEHTVEGLDTQPIVAGQFVVSLLPPHGFCHHQIRGNKEMQYNTS